MADIYGVQFDRINDYFSLQDNPAWDISVGGTQDAFYSFWIEVDSSTGSRYQYFFSNNGSVSASGAINIIFDNASDNIRVLSGGSDDVDGSTLSIPTGYMYVVMQYTASTDRISIVTCLEGGSEVRNVAANASFTDFASTLWQLGRRPDGNADRYFGGKVFNVAKGDSLLSTADVESLASDFLNYDPTDNAIFTPVIYFPMNEGVGTTITDTQLGLTGTGVGFPGDNSQWILEGQSGSGATAAITETGPSFAESISTTLTALSITADITETGPSFTESINATVNPSGVQRIFIHMATGTNNEFTASNWNPSGGFVIQMDFAPALSTGNLFLAHFGDFEVRYVRSVHQIYCYVDDSAGLPLIFDVAPSISTIDADTLYTLKITGVMGSTTLVVELDGIDCPVTNTSTSTPDFSGTINIGTVASGSTATMNGIIANVVLEDSGIPANSYAWAIDEQTANIESSETNTKDLSYISISQGLPTRELFTLNEAGTQWDGNNGTTLIIAGASSPGVSAAITETGPSFVESIGATITAAITAAITEQGPSFTESISALLSELAIDASITEVGPSFTDLIVASVVESGTLSAAIAEQGPSFTDSIVAQLDVNIAVTVVETGPSFIEVSSVTVNKGITTAITETGPSFTDRIIVKLPLTITVNPRNVILVKRKSNNVIVRRKSNTIRIR